MINLILALFLTAPGDAIYIKQGVTVVLDTTELGKLGNAFKSMFPEMIKANVVKAACHKPLEGGVDIRCKAEEESVLTDDEWLDLTLAGLVADSDWKLHLTDDVSDEQKALLSAFASDAFGGTLSLLYAFNVARDPENPAIFYASPYWRITASPAQCRQDYDAGMVIKILGREQ